MGRGGRYLLITLAIVLVGSLLRIPLRSAGMAGFGLVLPLLLTVPWLIMGWYRAQENRRPRCPNCDLPLSYRPLGPTHGMLECPALCGYRKLVGRPDVSS